VSRTAQPPSIAESTGSSIGGNLTANLRQLPAKHLQVPASLFHRPTFPVHPALLRACHCGTNQQSCRW